LHHARERRGAGPVAAGKFDKSKHLCAQGRERGYSASGGRHNLHPQNAGIRTED